MNGYSAPMATPRILVEGDQTASCFRAVPSSFNHTRGRNREDDASELLQQHAGEPLRKLDELSAQLNHSCKVADAAGGGFFLNGMAVSPHCNCHHGISGRFPDGSSPLNHYPVQLSPLFYVPNVALPQFYPAAHMENGCIHVHKEGSSLCSVDSFHHRGLYQPRAFNDYIHGHLNSDEALSFSSDGACHRPHSSYSHCRNACWPPPGTARLTNLSNSSLPPRSPGNHGLNAVLDSGLRSDELVKPRKSEPARRQRRPCRPFAGAAPFIVCSGCFDLLKIPGLALQLGKHAHKLRCGSCSRLISFELDGRRLIFSDDASKEKVAPSGWTTQALRCDDDESQDQVISHSFVYESSSDHSLTNGQDEKGRGFELSDSEKTNWRSSSSSSFSDGLDSPDGRIPSLPFCEDSSVASSGNEIVEDVGSSSKCLDQETAKDELPTQEDVPAEYNPNALNSYAAWKDEGEARVSRGKKGLMNRSLWSFSRFSLSSESKRAKVFVNGRHVPEHLVKKAEFFAGPIRPGDYWYDYQAGFWGIMGHPCLGIILPFIEEFNFPMRKDCADGNTGVLVNGRELHEQDLAVLSSRGLPAAEGHSYVVEFSGRVWDVETGEELGSLGKLAPTVERTKRGFGMQAPGDAA